MTDDTTTKVRALFLTALMVFSVFAGTVAFTGAATAQSGPDLRKATHYNDNNFGGPVLELAFTGNVNVSGNESVTLTFADGTTQTIDSDSNILADTTDDGQTLQNKGQSSRVVVNTTGTVYRNISSVSVSGFTDGPSGAEVTASEFTARYAPTVVDNSSTNAEAFVGANVLFDADSESVELDILKNNDIDVIRSTGTGSEVFLVDTDEFSTGTLNFTAVGGSTVEVELSNLGLGATADDVTTAENVTATVSSNTIDRVVDVQLLNTDGDEVANDTVTIDADGQASVDFGTQDAGNYTVNVTDVETQVEAGDSLRVTEAATGSATFGGDVVQQRGDIVEITINLDATETASFTFGSNSSGFNVSGVVTDASSGDADDGQVTVQVNTVSYTVTTVQSADDVSDVDFSATPSNVLATGNYDLQVLPGDTARPHNASGDAVNDINFGSMNIEPRETTQFRTHVVAGDSVPDVNEDGVVDADDVIAGLDEGVVTPRSEVAKGDVLVHQISASGLEGFVADASGSNTSEQFFNVLANQNLTLTIEQDNPQKNQDPKKINLDETNTDVIAGDDQYFLVTDTEDIKAAAGDGSYTATLSFDADEVDPFFATESFSTSFTAVEPTIEVTQPNATAGANATIAGTTNIAPGADVRVTIQSDDGVEPGFVRTQIVSVQQDGTFSATFDLSNNAGGDTYTVNAQRVGTNLADNGVAGTLQGGEPTTDTPTTTDTPATTTATPTPTPTATPTPTPTPTATPSPTPTPTATPTPTPTPTDTADTTAEPTEETTDTGAPGFTAVLGVLALLGAALLALRRRE